MICPRRVFRSAFRLLFGLVAVSFGIVTSLTPAYAQAGREVPFGDRVGPAVVNYNRLRPQIATAGLLQPGAVAELKALGIATIVDLRGPEEGTAVEKKAVEAAGLRYFNIPVTEGMPSDVQIAEFGRIVEDANNYPLIVHCASANRVGAMWTLYRARKGIPVEIAIEEGRTTGLQPPREADVRRRLQQVPAAH